MSPNDVYQPRHSLGDNGFEGSLKSSSASSRRVIGAAIAVAAIIGCGTVAAPAFADEPGGQGGVTALPSTGPGQGGVVTEPAPPIVDAAPQYDTGPGSFPDPVWNTAPTVWQEPEPYPGTYNPLPVNPIGPSVSGPVTKMTPVLTKPGYVKFGNYVAPQPDWLSDADARSLTRWSEKFRVDIANFWISKGVAADEASRLAASTVTGIAAGGAIGALTVGIPAAIVGAGIGALIGLGIGVAVAPITPPPFTPFAPAIGAAAGAGIGAVVVGGLGAAAGVAVGGTAGGLLGWLFGTGDPGADPGVPPRPGTPETELSDPPPPNPDANQFELDAQGLPGGGSVTYVVNSEGDVSGNVNIGPVSAPMEWTAEQADAPYASVGFLAQTARDTVADATAQISEQMAKAIPGVEITFPQLIPANA